MRAPVAKSTVSVNVRVTYGANAGAYANPFR